MVYKCLYLGQSITNLRTSLRDLQQLYDNIVFLFRIFTIKPFKDEKLTNTHLLQ